VQVSRSLRVAAVGVCMTLLAACGGDDAGSDTASGRLSIKMGTPSDTLSSSFYAFVAAEKLGYWEDENLKVELVPGSGSGALVEQMIAGNLVAGAPSLPSVVEGLGAGLKLVDVYTYSYGSIFGIWVPENSAIKGVGDLKGKNIGVSEAGGGETAVLNAALEDVGINPVTEVNLIPIGQGEATTLDAIQRGRVDAYASSKNDGHSLTVSGLKMREITPPLYEGFPGRSIISTPEGLKKNREQFVRMARGIAKATLFCDNNIEACKKFMKEAVPEQWVDTNDAEQSQGSLQFEEAVKTTSVPEGEQFGRHKPDQMEAFKDTVASITEDFEDFDVNDFLKADILAEVNNFDRAAIIAEAKAYK
jgi:NitT/TauT family transport system substrate-binding protein